MNDSILLQERQIIVPEQLHSQEWHLIHDTPEKQNPKAFISLCK